MSMFLRSLYHVVLESLHLSALVVIKKCCSCCCYAFFLLFVQGGPKKTRLFFRLDNFVTVSPRKACSMSKFSQFYRKVGTKLAFQ